MFLEMDFKLLEDVILFLDQVVFLLDALLNVDFYSFLWYVDGEGKGVSIHGFFGKCANCWKFCTIVI